MTPRPDVTIVGIGYVGLTLAATLADRGLRVWGYDRNEQLIQSLRAGQAPLYEPGLMDVLRARLGGNLHVDTALPETCAGIVIICVSTPVSEGRAPDLANLRAAIAAVAERLEEHTLVIVRSTVPIGTCRNVVLPILQARPRRVRLACCPERTIQGQALRELRTLPQVVGALDADSEQAAKHFWQQVAPRVVVVSSLEAAEMVKLINNCHTDVLYAFGNEVALMAHRLHLDPVELIAAANLDYPRPPLARPGFVAGPCLSKDPFLLLSSFVDDGARPRLIDAARSLNASLPMAVASHLINAMTRCHVGLAQAKVLVCGFAYKGRPVTDDVRGTPVVPMLDALRQHALEVHGHDFLVPSHVIASWGARPVQELSRGFEDARAVVFMNEHPDYHALPIVELAQRMRRPAVVYDCWRMFDARLVESVPDVHYAGIGYG